MSGGFGFGGMRRRPQTHVQVSSSVSGPPAWSTVWFDDFEGSDLDRTKWLPEQSCWGGGNNERQCYTDRKDNVRVEGEFSG